jgi:polyphosphate kinase
MLHKSLLQRIQREADNAAAGKPARIIIKVNALIESQLIQSLYAASRAGVEIDLIVRGICSLRPGLAGISERIRVRSVIGRFLEHTRIYYFENDGAPEIFCSSADWMERNMFRRVEIAFPILDGSLRKRVYRDLQLYLRDNLQSWNLNTDGSYERIGVKGRAHPFSAQQTLLETLAERA